MKPLALAQALAAQAFPTSTDQRMLHALGVTRKQWNTYAANEIISASLVRHRLLRSAPIWRGYAAQYAECEQIMASAAIASPEMLDVIGTRLFGLDWRSPMARLADVSGNMMSYYANGLRTTRLSSPAMLRLYRSLETRATELQRLVALLEKKEIDQ